MKLTKYDHAMFTVEKDGQTLIVDPGSFNGDYVSPENVVAIVITHEHGDHFDPDLIAEIYNKNPDSLLLADETVIATMPDHRGKAVKVGDVETVGEFTIEFFGGQHAIIHPSIPAVANLGIMINDLIYYPGDALTLPFKPVDTLALPASGPWFKLSEAMDFLTEVHPRFAFPLHDAINSELGNSMVDKMFESVAKQNDIEYARLTDSVEI